MGPTPFKRLALPGAGLGQNCRSWGSPWGSHTQHQDLRVPLQSHQLLSSPFNSFPVLAAHFQLQKILSSLQTHHSQPFHPHAGWKSIHSPQGWSEWCGSSSFLFGARTGSSLWIVACAGKSVLSEVSDEYKALQTVSKGSMLVLSLGFIVLRAQNEGDNVPVASLVLCLCTASPSEL